MHPTHTPFASAALALALMFFSAACQAQPLAPGQSAEPAQARHPLEGTWYGLLHSPAEKTVQRFLIVRQPDGHFELQLRTYAPGKPMQEIRNSGLWGGSGSLLTMLTTRVNGQAVPPRDPAYTSVYVIKQLEGKTLRYEHVASGRVIETVRVTPHARLPD